MRKKVLFLFIGLSIYLFVLPARAEAGFVEFKPCEKINPIFEFLWKLFPFRPNPFTPCKNKETGKEEEPEGSECGANIEVIKNISVPKANLETGDPDCNPQKPKPGENVTCTKRICQNIPISLDLSKAELPFWGVSCPDGINNECYIDTLDNPQKMKYLNSWLAGTIQSGSLSPVESQSDIPMYSGVIKKLLPVDDLRGEIIAEASNQTACYIKDNKVISRKEGKELYEKDKTSVIIYTYEDLNQYLEANNIKRPNSDDEPWYSCYLQAQFFQTQDLKAKFSIGSTEIPSSMGHILSDEQLTNLLSKISVPEGVKADVATNTSSCEKNKIISAGLRGDPVFEAKDVTINPYLCTSVKYSYRELTAFERDELISHGIEPPTTVMAEAKFSLPVEFRVPKEMNAAVENFSRKTVAANLPISADILGASFSLPISESNKNVSLNLPGGEMKGAYDLQQCALVPGSKCNLELVEEPETGDGEINCDQSVPDISIPGMITKTEAEQLALNWVQGKIGNHVKECYNDVIRKAQNAGVNPAVVLMVWLNESNASNYDISLQDFGINDLSLEKDFNKQIEKFLQLPAVYKSNYPQCFGQRLTDIEAFAYLFRTGHCNQGDPDGQEYYNLWKTIWTWVAPSCSLPNYPTDTVCP